MSYSFFLDENHSLVGVSGWSWEWASEGFKELLVRPCRGVETWRMVANRFFDRINKINRIGVGVVYIL